MRRYTNQKFRICRGEGDFPGGGQCWWPVLSCPLAFEIGTYARPSHQKAYALSAAPSRHGGMANWQSRFAGPSAQKKKKRLMSELTRALSKLEQKCSLFFFFFFKSSYTFSFGLGTPLFSSVFFSVHGKSEAKTFQNLKARAI